MHEREQGSLSSLSSLRLALMSSSLTLRVTPSSAMLGCCEVWVAEAVRFELTDRLTGRLFSRQLG
jgi:hypothetical protein